jgi:hypothetical protein
MTAPNDPTVYAPLLEALTASAVTRERFRELVRLLTNGMVYEQRLPEDTARQLDSALRDVLRYVPRRATT